MSSVKTAKEFAAFRSHVLSLLAMLAPSSAPLVRPTLGANPTAQEAIDYAEKLKAFESSPLPSPVIPEGVRKLALAGVCSLVSDFVENDGHEFSPYGRPRVPHSIGQLDHEKIGFYAKFLRAEWVAERFDVSVPTVYLNKKKETFVY
jgi:hypothetical protein